MFKLDNKAEISGTHLVGEYWISPVLLKDIFGEPEKADEYKVSGEYIFSGEDGEVLTLYDWKCTSLYDDGYESPSSFWASSEPHDFHIGGKEGCDDFKEWLSDVIVKWGEERK